MKFNLYTLLDELGSDDGQGSGAGGGGSSSSDDNKDEKDDIADKDIDENKDNNSDSGGDDKKDDNDDKLKEIQKDLDDLRTKDDQREKDETVKVELSKLEDKYEDFDVQKVAKRLSEIKKKDGEEASDLLNNPLGWEKLYLDMKLEAYENEDPEFGRNTDSVVPSNEILEKAKTETVSVEEQQAVLGKYF